MYYTIGIIDAANNANAFQANLVKLMKIGQLAKRYANSKRVANVEINNAW